MSSTDRGRLAIVRQTDPDVLPSTLAWQLMRVTSAALSYQKETTTSNELDYSAQPSSTVKIAAKSSGSISFEWSPTTWDDLLEAALRGDMDSTINATGALGLNGSTKALTLTNAFTNAKVGQFVLIHGCVEDESYSGAGDSPNNGWWEIETVTSDDAVVLKDPADKMVTETAPADAWVKSKRLINGVLKIPHAIEESFSDAQSYLLFLGQYVNTMSFNLSAGEILTGEFGFMGSDVQDEQGIPTTVGALTIAASDRSVTGSGGVFADAKAGQRIKITGMTNADNNVTNARIATKESINKITLMAGPTLVNETGPATATVETVSSSWSVSATYTDPTQTSVLNATDNVADILIDGEISTACFKSLTLNVNNNLRETPCTGREFPRIDYGTPACTGNFEKMFVDLDLWRKMRDHGDMSLHFGLLGSDGGRGIHISLPRLNINSDGLDLSGGRNSDVLDKVEFNAQKYTNSATGETYYIQVCVA